MHPVTESHHLTLVELQRCPRQALPCIRKANRPHYLLGEKNMMIRVRNSLVHACLHTGNLKKMSKMQEIFHYQCAATNEMNACPIIMIEILQILYNRQVTSFQTMIVTTYSSCNSYANHT